MRGENRKAPRVHIEHCHPVNLMGVDGTWRRSCFLLDVSDSGAKLEVEGPVNVLQAREFFLLLSSTGLAFRRCELGHKSASVSLQRISRRRKSNQKIPKQEASRLFKAR